MRGVGQLIADIRRYWQQNSNRRLRRRLPVGSADAFGRHGARVGQKTKSPEAVDPIAGAQGDKKARYKQQANIPLVAMQGILSLIVPMLLRTWLGSLRTSSQRTRYRVGKAPAAAGLLALLCLPGAVAQPSPSLPPPPSLPQPPCAPLGDAVDHEDIVSGTWGGFTCASAKAGGNCAAAVIAYTCPVTCLAQSTYTMSDYCANQDAVFATNYPGNTCADVGPAHCAAVPLIRLLCPAACGTAPAQCDCNPAAPPPSPVLPPPPLRSRFSRPQPRSNRGY